jgi:hypothetical protein
MFGQKLSAAMRLLRCVFTRQPRLLVCEADLDMVLEAIRGRPDTYAAEMPQPWSRKRLLEELGYATLKHRRALKPGDTLSVGYGIWAHINFVGIDLLNYPHVDGSYQIYLSVRTVNTHPTRLIDLKS